jgi:hypothetical protein
MYENGYQRIKIIKFPDIVTVIEVVRMDSERTKDFRKATLGGVRKKKRKMYIKVDG